jgi:uncharacterized protein (DUF2252 family)
MPFQDDNDAYETWLATQCAVVAEDLRYKHKRMALDPFIFLRATYFRWAKTIEDICPDATNAPTTLCVGDIHLENFGTWRDNEGRLVWGVNDFDEAYEMPYIFDLVRLATSVRLAPDIKLVGRDIAQSLLEGYAAGLDNPRPTLLDEQESWMLPYVASSAKSSGKFWKQVEEYPSANPPPVVKNGLVQSLPKGAEVMRFCTRVAGGGSLGRPRYVAVATFRGGKVVREAKALVPSAWIWAHRMKSAKSQFLQLAHGPYRSADPFMSIQDNFVFRRVAPDSRKIELGAKGAVGLDAEVLRAMGFDLASIHAARNGGVSALKADVRKRDREWLRAASKTAEAAVTEDWKSWRKSQQ